MNVMHTRPEVDRSPDVAPRSRGRHLLMRILIVLALVALAFAAFRAFGGDEPTIAASTPSPAMTVTTATPQRADWATVVTASGAIAPWEEASVGTQIGPYQLVEVRVNVGDQVRRGQVLARLNPALLRAEEAQLLAGSEQAEANRRRGLGLQASGGISDQDVLGFVTQARTSAAQLAAKRLELRYTEIVAPDDGVVSARIATLGAVVPAGQELFRLIRGNRLEWRGELSASQLARIARGQRVALTLPDGTDAVAVVRQTAPSLDGQSRLALVYADVRPGSRARAGMFANGRVVVGGTPALTIPAESVVVRDGRSYVLKLATAGATPRVALQPVTTGRREGRAVEIVQGLTGQERLVVRGAGFLDDGDVVRVVPVPGSPS